KLVLYNGSSTSRLPYSTTTLSGTITNSCNGRGVVVISYGVNGIENGSPDGFALIDASGNVVEFLSYEGSFTAAGTAPASPAAGMTSVDIGVAENGEAVDATTGVQSLKRNGSGAWSGPSPNNFGVCNDEPPGSVATVAISPDSATVFVDATVQLSAAAKDSAGATVADAAITWSSLNQPVATVSATGLVTGVAPGNALIVAASANGKADTITVRVTTPTVDPAGPVFVSEIHYDNDGTDTGEAIEIEGPAGKNLTGWSVVLYNQTGGAVYNTRVLSVTIPDLCNGRGVVVVDYPSNGIQNGPEDGFALVNNNGQVVEFLSYEGTLTATNGPAAGQQSVDIGVSEGTSSPVTKSLQRDSAGTWYGPYNSTMGACNPAQLPPPAISFTGRFPTDVPLPVGFQDQLFASLVDARGDTIHTTFTWSSETPSIATIDTAGVMTALSAGSAIFRATAATGITATWTLPTIVATASATAMYGNNTEFGAPTDSDPSDDFIITHPEYTTSFSATRGTPNWVSYDLDATHFGAQDRCDCFTFDPAAAGLMTPYTTNAYTGSAAINGFSIDRGHLARSFDRTSGSLDNAYTFYFSNIVPQASDQNQGPWAAMETFLGDLARFQNKEVYIVAGVAGSKGTLKNQGIVTIPEYTWKVALVMPRDQGLDDVDSYDDVQVYAAVMPNVNGIRNVDWHTYLTTVDSVEALSGYDLLKLLPDPIEIAVESNTVPPVAVVDGPYTGYLPGESINMSAAGSSDADAGQTLTYAWNFGDGSTGTGVNVSHAYDSAGTYNVQLIVTDPLGLADTVTTTATVKTQSQGTSELATMVSQLLNNSKISKGNATSLSAKITAALASFDSGNSTAAVNQLNALLNEINAMVASGRLSASDAAPMITLINRIIDSV
ncbi:MAG TPA: DNA/RNA non-specific endonuclease, partial [Gemmatimonadaceae bacterium]